MTLGILRTELAKQILGMFETGLASSLTFFLTPDGKNGIFIKDITPVAEQFGWRIFYFSFLDAGFCVVFPSRDFMLNKK